VLRAVLFDFNGILVDDEPVHLEMFQRVLADEGITLTAEDYYRDYLGFDDRGCLAAVLQAAGETATVPRLMRLIARKASYYQEYIRKNGYPFFPGAVELVREVADSGRRIGIVSGANPTRKATAAPWSP
jgi:beta-phosphoglucomutase-like phosphatase (HAD superfamily)